MARRSILEEDNQKAGVNNGGHHSTFGYISWGGGIMAWDVQGGEKESETQRARSD